jgi:hypothetical protein
MNSKLSLKYSLELVATLLSVAALLGVLQSFIIGKHYVIPTMILFMAVIFGNLARYGYRDRPWAKHVLFWMAFMITSHTFFALFWAAKPRDILGDAFLPVYGALCVVFGFLAWQYARKNALFR